MRSKPKNPIVIIPARMGSTRLPGKPLASIADEPMIVHCWRSALKADIGPVVVACAEKEIAEVIENVGGTSVLTNERHHLHVHADVKDYNLYQQHMDQMNGGESLKLILPH